MQRLNPTVVALLAAVAVLLLLIAYFQSRSGPEQDKLSDNQLTTARAPDPAKRCASKPTYDLLKRELFRRAAELRGSDQAAYDRLSTYAALRMDNPVMEGEDQSTGAVNCSGSLSLDLPPGVAVIGGRRTLTANVDYSIRRAADGSGDVLLLRNADAIIAPLATLSRVGEPAPQPGADVEGNLVAPEPPEANVAASESVSIEPGPATSYPGRPSFDCANARSRGEIAVCSDSGIASLDVNMAAQYRRSLAVATPAQKAILQSTRERFLAYRDRCPNRQCIADSYIGRMREIRDIMEGRWRAR